MTVRLSDIAVFFAGLALVFGACAYLATTGPSDAHIAGHCTAEVPHG